MSDGREGSRLLYHHAAKVDRRAHAVDRYLKLPEAFGVPIPEQLRFPLPTGDALPRFDPYPPFVLLHPFARGARKSLSNSVIEQFCHAFDPIRVVIVGKTVRKIAAPDNCVNLANQTSLLQLIWLIRTARFIISVDSGPMHIAAAVTSQLFSIHTWSDRAASGPTIPTPGFGKIANCSESRNFRTPVASKKAAHSPSEMSRPLSTSFADRGSRPLRRRPPTEERFREK